MLINQRQTELWANNKNPYYATYAPNGVSIYSKEEVGKVHDHGTNL